MKNNIILYLVWPLIFSSCYVYKNRVNDVNKQEYTKSQMYKDWIEFDKATPFYNEFINSTTDTAVLMSMYGGFPSDQIALLSTGEIVYFCQPLGRYISKVDQRYLRVLFRKIDRYNLFQYEEDYFIKDCENSIFFILTIKFGSKLKTIIHDWECEEIPKEKDLKFIETMIFVFESYAYNKK